MKVLPSRRGGVKVQSGIEKFLGILSPANPEVVSHPHRSVKHVGHETVYFSCRRGHGTVTAAQQCAGATVDISPDHNVECPLVGVVIRVIEAETDTCDGVRQERSEPEGSHGVVRALAIDAVTCFCGSVVNCEIVRKLLDISQGVILFGIEVVRYQ